jgi:NAD(P)-dependent dehydrogenase (short-subunit alcohol dehydrogenase family)
MDLGLTDKVAFVTGGSSGVGTAVARSLATEGARVAVGFHTGRAEVERLVAELRAAGAPAMAVPHDLADPASSQAAVDAIVEAWGRLDVLVSCAWTPAGWPSPDRLDTELSPAAAWREQLGCAEGTAQAAQAAIVAMKAGGWGRIVLISSGAAEEGVPGLEAYAAAKASLHALNRSLARGLGRAGILSNVVMPGFVMTERNRQFVPPAAFEQWAGMTPTGRLATVDEVAAIVTFLASAANGSVTGAAVRVSGGL